MLQYEQQGWRSGYARMAGVDEAGRGPLAGPVVAAAVFIERTLLESEINGVFLGLTDSKRLSAARRNQFFRILSQTEGVRIGVGQASVNEIDEINILRATHLAMERAVCQIVDDVDFLLIDGRPVPGLPRPSQAIVGGDARSLLIAAASVVAKVTRDRIMDELDRQYPAYGFSKHRGYGTAGHLEALRACGPSPAHRRSFAPVAACGI